MKPILIAIILTVIFSSTVTAAESQKCKCHSCCACRCVCGQYEWSCPAIPGSCLCHLETSPSNGDADVVSVLPYLDALVRIQFVVLGVLFALAFIQGMRW